MKKLLSLLALLALPVLLLLSASARAADVTEGFPPGTEITLVASADGIPAPTFQWFKNGVALEGATTEILKLASITTNDVGRYTVVATNVAGTATSEGYNLQIWVPPSVPTIRVTAKKPTDVTLSVPKGVKVVYQ